MALPSAPCRPVLLPWIGVLFLSAALGTGAAAQEPPPGDVTDETAQVDDLDLKPENDAVADVADVPEASQAPAALAPAAPAAADPLADAEFRRELRTVEEGVASLKERVFRSKATLELLKELVIDAAASGSRVVLWHVNQLGGGYSMESVQYFLDGKNVFSRVDPEGSLDVERELKVHEQTVPPGTHELSVNYVLRGRGYKIFSYLRAYQFKLQSSYSFKVEDGMVSLIRVVADSRGGFRSFVERPTVQYDERSEAFREE